MDNLPFLAKNFLGNLLMPLSLALLLLLWALLLLLRRRTRWLGYLVVLVATGLLFVASYGPLANSLIAGLEGTNPRYQQLANRPVDYIVVLGHWHQTAPGQPLTSQVSATGIVRLMEGLRIHQLNPGSKLILTGFRGINPDPVSYPEKLSELAQALGVPANNILVHSGPRDTREEARLIAENYSEGNLVLVTTASHMPRALTLFHQHDLQPIPAPTDHRSKPLASWWTFPKGSTLANSEYWAHEKLGQLWNRLIGQRFTPSAPGTSPTD